VVSTSRDNDLKPKKGETVEKKTYDGCPKFNGEEDEEDPFGL
jgi:hypothetical protein